MFKKSKILLFIFAVTASLTPLSNALALELNYPRINFPGAPTITTSASLISYAQYFFMFLVVISGFVGVISIAYMGAKILILSAAGNPDAVGEARKNIFGSILGIILLMFAFAILNTINYELVTLKDVNFPNSPTPGFLYAFNLNGETHFLATAGSEIDMTSDGNPADSWYWDLYRTAVVFENARLYLVYGCQQPNKNAIVQLYSEVNFSIDPQKNSRAENDTLAIGGIAFNHSYENTNQAPNVKSVRLMCGNNSPADEVLLLDPSNPSDNVKSWQADLEQPGVSFYYTKNCTGVSTPTFRESTSDIRNITGVKSVRITNGQTKSDIYGVYLNGGESIANTELCAEEPIINPEISKYPSGTTPVPPEGTSDTPSSLCYQIPLLPSGDQFRVTNANIFNYRRVGDIPSSTEVAIELDTGRRKASLKINWLKDYSAPAPGSTPALYKKINFSPNYLLQTSTTNPNNGLGVIYAEGGGGECNNGGSINGAPSSATDCTKYIRFNLKKSYLMVLRSQTRSSTDVAGGFLKTCTLTSDNLFLPFNSIGSGSRSIYRIDIIPIYKK